MKTHSGDPPGESECIGRIKKDDRHNIKITITIIITILIT